MNTTTPPFQFFQSLASRLQPPAWVVDEVQHRIVLFLNHVLMQEKEAQDRLSRKKGSVLHIRWGVFEMDLLITPAGLLDLAGSASKADLLLTIAVNSPLALLQSALAGKRPPVSIEGDVQLAAELGWLAENLRWDVEEDLARAIGDIPAHALADAGRKLLAGLKTFADKNPLNPATGTAPASTAASPASSWDGKPAPSWASSSTTAETFPASTTPEAGKASA